MNKNPLTDVVPGRARKIGYATLFIVGTGIAGTFAGFSAVGEAAPKWLLFASAFYTVVAGPTYALPFSNVQPDHMSGDPGA